MVVHTHRYTTPSKSSPSSSRPIWTRYWKVASTEILYSASRILSVRLIVAPGKHRLDHVLDGRILHREVDDGHFRQQLGGHPGDPLARPPPRNPRPDPVRVGRPPAGEVVGGHLGGGLGGGGGD